MLHSIKKTDLRVIRTKKMIFEAFVLLVEEKGYEAVTIQDIASEAMINRATFYAHFKDKNDLYDEVFSYALDAFTKILDPKLLENGNQVQIKKLEKMLTQVFTAVKKNQNFYLILTEGPSGNTLKLKIKNLLDQQYAEIFNQLKITENDVEVPIDFIIEYMSSIFIGMVHWWLNSDGDFPPEQMAHLLIKLVGNGHLTVLGIEVVS
ncbi:TetR/AcrR family transcriptional regulator [Carnobacterium gallinarum]|uniref:TetR/AcrR family transcriptional regulator n=1 Tax=Carnobacterium gallinarum TaxID=2749 RepID=UPI00055648BB|nr:TetR/AcrR family transcriptional regulator [Carnobacterium gallinarum]